MSLWAKPMVHTGGTSKKELVDQYESAHDQLEEAISKVEETAPNKRDYYKYPAGDVLFTKAVGEHEERLRKLREVQAELLELLEHVNA